MDTTHAELIAASGAARDEARRAQVRTWNIRLRDMLEDDPDAADALRELLAGLGAGSGSSSSRSTTCSARCVTPSRHIPSP